jgi:hypothetical protein
MDQADSPEPIILEPIILEDARRWLESETRKPEFAELKAMLRERFSKCQALGRPYPHHLPPEYEIPLLEFAVDFAHLLAIARRELRQDLPTPFYEDFPTGMGRKPNPHGS